MIEYQIEKNITAEEFRNILVRSTLGERRPIDDPERLKTMLENASLILTARDQGKLIGIARAITDFVYCTYLSDLAVDLDYQKKGIGKALIWRIKLETPKATLILLAAPKAVDYYPHIGMDRHDACFLLQDPDKLR